MDKPMLIAMFGIPLLLILASIGRDIEQARAEADHCRAILTILEESRDHRGYGEAGYREVPYRYIRLPANQPPLPRYCIGQHH